MFKVYKFLRVVPGKGIGVALMAFTATLGIVLMPMLSVFDSALGRSNIPVSGAFAFNTIDY